MIGWSRRPALRLVALLALVVVVVGAALRLALGSLLAEQLSALELATALVLGGLDDLLIAALLTAPIAAVWSLGAERWLNRPLPRALLVGGFTSLVVFGAFVEFFFFEEFDARFNNIAVDYVLFPHEVVGNVFESYDVPLFVGLALAAGIAAAWFARTQLVDTVPPIRTWRRRLGCASIPLLTSIASAGALANLPHNPFENREANEIAGNGLLHLARAFWTADLDYELYYRTLPEDEARSRAARVLGAALDEHGALEKRFEASPSGRAPKQVVVVIEESLGSDFVGATGHAKTACTPELDRWMTQGLAVRNLIANGNRTVRGLEGILCSFVPLPGDAIIKRAKTDRIATLASVFRSADYSTAFFYGGFGLFDFMKPFMLANGFDEFIEQPDFPSDAFRTIWGVADEHIFDALLARQRLERAKDGRLFATLLSVSNHKPYRVPAGRPGHCADRKPGRADAVRYADWCLGRYLDSLRAEGFLEDTLVLVVGDHGARVYGAEQLPIRSYRIPALFIGGPELAGRHLDRLCSQIDLAPTLLDLCGLGARASFLGDSLLDLPANGGRAFVHHNRDVGLVTDDTLVVLGLRKTLSFYGRPNRESLEFTRLDPERVDARALELADDATAVFQTAYRLLETHALSLAAVDAPR